MTLRPGLFVFPTALKSEDDAHVEVELSISLPTLKISSMIGAKLESFIKTEALWIGALNPTFLAQATRR